MRHSQFGWQGREFIGLQGKVSRLSRAVNMRASFLEGSVTFSPSTIATIK